MATAETSPQRPPAAATVSVPADYQDADLDAAALKLDQHSRLLRADMLAQLHDCKLRLSERQQAAAAAAAHDAQLVLAAKQQQLDAATAELAHQQEIVRRTGAVLFKAARWRRQLALGCRTWRAWRLYVRRQRGLQAMVQAATTHYEVGRLRRRVLRAWRTLAAAQWRPRVLAQAAAAVENERQHIMQQAEQLTAQHARRLMEVEGQLAAALDARAALEADTKRAFMRGVCALNLEAMALMKGGLPTGIAEPAQDDEDVEVQQQGAAADNAPAQQTGEHASCMPQRLPWQLQGGGAPRSMPAWGQHSEPRTGAAKACTTTAPGTRQLLKPAAEAAKPLITVTPRQPLPAAVLPQPVNGQPPVVRHPPYNTTAVSQARCVSTLLPCSLPSNVPAHVARQLAGKRAQPQGRPSTAPSSRLQSAAGAAGYQQPHQQQQQQVSQRSLAGQERAAQGAPSPKSRHPLVMRGPLGASH